MTGAHPISLISALSCVESVVPMGGKCPTGVVQFPVNCIFWFDVGWGAMLCSIDVCSEPWMVVFGI